jgi:hypothetical protein
LKSRGFEWQSVQACCVGMWFAGLPSVAPAKLAVLWHAPQSPVAGCEGLVAGSGRVTIAIPNHDFPASWQDWHAVPETPAWFIAVPAKVVKATAEWQLSQASPGTGMWPGGWVFGVTFANASPGPWQVAQPELMPWWFIVATE